MREINGHKVNECNEAIRIFAGERDEKSKGTHRYDLYIGTGPEGLGGQHVALEFQNGPIKEVGTNGVTAEALLVVVADYLGCFQDGPYRGRENALAITKLEEALHWLLHRTRARMARGVEGTHQL